MNPDPSNIVFQQAVAFVNQTNKHLFVTGKAGTGKTTFLKYIKENSFKKMAVVAPTGVAAINAGGVTIHSFFQLPLGAFVPDPQPQYHDYSGEVNNPSSLLRNLRIPSAKRTLIRELDLLIIDEVSMVRADLLDAIDTVMRHIRRQPLMPFGGVQLVYIGDLFQLPPVVRNDEWRLLSNYYATPFFFSAKVVRHTSPLYIELKKIYRQKDDSFIHILNNIRNNCCTYDDLEYLHQYYKPGYVPPPEENFITLTSHNGKADDMNQTKLQHLKAKQHVYEATTTGEFNDRSYPADKTLYLKVGAQVMFIKNDKGEARRYYNGKIATVTFLSADTIKVAFAGENTELEIEKETWKNIRYKYQQEKDEVDEEELGSFTQYPIRLAWAITIHKSQGLTFEKAIIDAGASFAPGQVYVSLSRLTGLSGLILYSRIPPHTISTDERVIEFVKNEMNEEELQETLEAEQKTFAHHTLITGFDWSKLVNLFDEHYTGYEHRQIPEQNTCIEFSAALLAHVKQQNDVALKFKLVLQQLCTSCEEEGGYQKLHARVQAAATYFEGELNTKLSSPLVEHIKWITSKGKVKKYIKDLQALQAHIQHKKQQLQQSVQLAATLASTSNIHDVLTVVDEQRVKAANQKAEPVAEKPSGKREKGDTQRQTLQMFKAGRSISDIASERKLAPVTIEGHLAGFITTGEVDILDLVSADKLDTIIAAVSKLQPEMPETYAFSSIVKQNLPEHFTYGEIRAALKFMERQQKTDLTTG